MVSYFQAGKPVTVGALSVTAFRKSHDASDPHSFMISADKINIGVFTDIGYPGKELIRFFEDEKKPETSQEATGRLNLSQGFNSNTSFR